VIPRKMGGPEKRLMKRLRKRAFHRQGGLCFWCAKPMNSLNNDPGAVSAEHKIPLHAGGLTVAWNVVAACRECNSERHPEFNHLGAGLVASAGDDSPRSPFEVLRTASAPME
jgi:5-methylcytosine-specific restriction endonuclease McrA